MMYGTPHIQSLSIYSPSVAVSPRLWILAFVRLFIVVALAYY